MAFPEDLNQLELLNTHGHLIPRGASSLWSGSKGEEEELEEEEAAAALHNEEWYLEKEETLRNKPEELILWAAEHNRVSGAFLCSAMCLCIFWWESFIFVDKNEKTRKINLHCLKRRAILGLNRSYLI